MEFIELLFPPRSTSSRSLPGSIDTDQHLYIVLNGRSMSLNKLREN